MKFVHFDAPAGLSGNMILGALLDLGVDADLFKKTIAGLKLPVSIKISECRRAGLRGLHIDIVVRRKNPIERTWSDIQKVIDESPFSTTVKKNARTIFRRLFEAEAKVHGRDLRTAHLHEAGADDALVDVLGACWLAETLDIGVFISSPLNLGEGFVKTSHGLLPVPAPAAAELLKDIPVYAAWAKDELVTPTGAAIISGLAGEFRSFPEITYERIGYGAGTKDIPGLPNILRAFYGDVKNLGRRQGIFLVETTIDDSTPQLLAHVLDRSLQEGALDAFLTPVVMKKNRLATKLTILAETDKTDRLIEMIFRETSSIGVRFFPVERRVLEREHQKVLVQGHEIRIKVSRLGGETVNIQPEFSDCLKVAKRVHLPLKEVSCRATREYGGKSDKRKTPKES